MRLREGLRQYVKDANAETAATGWPMVRAMVLAFPQGIAGFLRDRFERRGSADGKSP
jgi:alpha-glucosidase (family GH31 glycosyl hydrolase)